MALAAVGLSTYIWNNNLKSGLLLLFYPLLLVGMLWGGAFAYARLDGLEGDPLDFANRVVLRYGGYVFLVVAVWFAVAFFAHQRMINLMTGARPVTREEQPRLYNLLENLCIARGIAMPRLFILPDGALNAYASGISQGTFAITVTQGLLDALDDTELETVLAHELTHIINRDVRLLVFCLTFAGMLSFLSEAVARMLRGGAGGRGGGRSAGLLVLIAFCFLMVGYLFAVLLRFAVSRNREYLADAGAVELTKNPGALVSALSKISGRSALPKVPADVRQLFFDNRAGVFSLFATHPSIDHRIAALQVMGAAPYHTTRPLDAALPPGAAEAGPVFPAAQTASRSRGYFGFGCVIILGVIMTVTGMNVYAHAGRYLRESSQITAQVVDKWQEGDNGLYRITYRFAAAGRPYVKTSQVSQEEWQALQEGARVSVTYLTSNPADNVLSSRVPTHGKGGMLLGIGLMLTVGGVFGAVRWSRRA